MPRSAAISRGELDREAEGVVQVERASRRRSTSRPTPRVVEQRQAGAQRLPEALLLALDDAADEVVVARAARDSASPMTSTSRSTSAGVTSCSTPSW